MVSIQIVVPASEGQPDRVLSYQPIGGEKVFETRVGQICEMQQHVSTNVHGVSDLNSYKGRQGARDFEVDYFKAGGGSKNTTKKRKRCFPFEYPSFSLPKKITTSLFLVISSKGVAPVCEQ